MSAPHRNRRRTYRRADSQLRTSNNKRRPSHRTCRRTSFPPRFPNCRPDIASLNKPANSNHRRSRLSGRSYQRCEVMIDYRCQSLYDRPQGSRMVARHVLVPGREIPSFERQLRGQVLELKIVLDHRRLLVALRSLAAEGHHQTRRVKGVQIPRSNCKNRQGRVATTVDLVASLGNSKKKSLSRLPSRVITFPAEHF
jgi:hypothetical protein